MDKISTISGIATEFFTHLGLDFSELEVIIQDEERDIYNIHIKSTDSSLMIGLHGKTLEEIQILIVQICEKVLGTHCVIHIEVNDYLAEKQKKLFAIVDRKVELAIHNGIDQVIYDLSWYERKQVHDYINRIYPDIETESRDGERGRELHVRLKAGVSPTASEVWLPKNLWSRNITEDLAALDLEGSNI